MLHPSKAVVRTGTPAEIARQGRRTLAALARPAGSFDASRYFRGDERLGFYNVGTPSLRRLGKAIARAHRQRWTIDDAIAFAAILIEDRHLEAKGLGIEVLAVFRRDFEPRHLAIWKGWLARNRAANWATTDTVCGMLIGPLLVAHPRLIPVVASWSRDRNLWVRRASAVGLLAPIRKASALDEAYGVARALHADKEDLIQKAVGWMLREAGRVDASRLERYLRANGPTIPRTTLRYAIERFPPAKRNALLKATKSAAARGRARTARGSSPILTSSNP